MEEHPRFFEQPLVRALTGFGGFIIAYFLMNLLAYLWVIAFVPPVEEETPSIFTPDYFLSPVNDPLQLLLGMAVCFLGLLVWLVFFAQFVLPVHTLGDRLKVIERLLSYLTGNHGAAVFVENGLVRAREEEKTRKGPGVIWLDSASAAVLRNDTTFTRAIGPGVHFTNPGERIAGTVDLHSLTQVVGPLESDTGEADPFRVSNNHPEYQAIQNRRWETSALTRDGIEVLASISVTFHIACKPGQGNTRFGFDKENVLRAVRDSITRGADTSHPLWSELPARMAVDVWREYVRKFRQDELFVQVGKRPETGLQLIAALTASRLKQPEVGQYDDFGRPVLKSADVCREIFDRHRQQGLYADLDQRIFESFLRQKSIDFASFYDFLLEHRKMKEAGEFEQKMPSREYRTLSDMGWEVQSVNIKRVWFAPEIEDRIVANWTTLWKKNAEKSRDQVERNRKLAEVLGQEDAVKIFASDAADRDLNFEQPPTKYDILYALTHNTFLGVRRNSVLLKRAGDLQIRLSEIFGWMREKGTRG